jgi:hypothetical protein
MALHVLATEASVLFRSTSNTSLMMSSTAGYPPVGNVNGENVQESKLMEEELFHPPRGLGGIKSVNLGNASQLVNFDR